MTSPDFILDVPLMDSDHAFLESLLSKVEGTDDDALATLLIEIETEMRAHFQREEDLMRARGVVILSCHEIQHGLLLSQFAFAHEAARLKDMPGLRHFLGSLLPRLLSDHINTVDRMTAGLLRSNTDAACEDPNAPTNASACLPIRS